MAITCPELSVSQVGPYNQHLVLGGSLTQMTLNAGWGSTASSCSLGLAIDPCSHWRDQSAYGTFNTSRNSVLQQPDSFPQKSALEKSPPGPRVSVGPNAATPIVYATGFSNVPDAYEGLTRNIAQADFDKEQFQQNNDLNDLGKVVWSTNPYNAANGGFTRKNWLGPDPGFIADQSGSNEDGVALQGFDVNGTCVFAKFDGIFFGGFIKNWEGKLGSSGGTYSVQLQNMTPLLNGFSMILNEYTGSIGTRYQVGDPNIPIATLPSTDYIGDYNGTYFGGVRGGNHPNVVNLYGIATAFYGFTGSSWRSEQGVSAADVYFLLRSLLDPTNTYIPHSAWFPYGAIVGRSLIDRTTGQMVNTSDTAFSYNGNSLTYQDLGWMPAKLAIDNRHRPLFALDMSEVPMPPNDLIISEPSLTITGFLDLIAKGSNFDYQIDCLPAGASSIYSAIIKVRIVSRNTSAPIHSLKSTLANTDAVESVSYGEEFNPSNVRKVIIGGPQQRVLQFTTASKNLYQETRTYDPYAVQNRTVVPHALNLTSARQPGMNAATLPSVNTRWYKSFTVNAGVVAQNQTTSSFFSLDNNGLQATKVFGNYAGRQPVAMPQYNDVTNSYPLSSDLISPYYGEDSRGNTRLVYYDKYMGQIQILTNMNDWSLWAHYSIPPGVLIATPPQKGGKKKKVDPNQDPNQPPVIGNEEEPDPPAYAAIQSWIITETEIRAAQSGLEQFLYYLFEGYKEGFRGFTAVLFMNYITYNFGADVASVLQGGGSFRKKIINATLSGISDLDDFKMSHPLTNGTTEATSTLGDYRIRIELEALRKFIAEEIGQYHAKNYCVRLPEISSYVDRQNNVQFSYVPVESGWEEEGNPLDDTMVFGGTFANYLANENGTMPPVLGFSASLEYDRLSKKVSDDDVTAMPVPSPAPSPPPKAPGEPSEDEEITTPDNKPDGSGGANEPPDEILPEVNKGAPTPNTLTTPTPLGNPPVRTENSRGWYCPLDTEKLKGSDGALYLTSAAQMRGTRANFYASLGYAVPANYAQYDTNTDAHLQRGRNSACIRKVYLKGSLLDIAPRRRGEGKKIGYNALQGSNPMCVVVGPSPVEQNQEKGVVFTHLLQKYLFNFFGYTVPKESGYGRPWTKGKMIIYKNGLWTPQLAASELYAAAKRRDQIVTGTVTADSTDESSDHLEFNVGGCAIPNFAAIPIKSNVTNYGPWASVPGLVENVLFNNPSLGTLEPLNKTMADNIVGGVTVEYASDAVPWNYGGIEYLDYAKLALVSAGIQAQQGLEKGSFTSPGILLADGQAVSVGSFLAGNGPVVNAINVNIGSGGVKTNYTLRTWTKKVGFYNEERAKEIANLGKRGNQIRQENADLQIRIASIPTQVINAVDKALTKAAEEKAKAKKTSPVEAFIGSAVPNVRDGAKFADMNKFGPSWAYKEGGTGGPTAGPDDTYQHISRTELYDKGEFGDKAMKPETYNSQSMMSLDGLISPISFYPTPYGSTYAITKYDREHCPYCRGQATYNYNVLKTAACDVEFPSYDDIPIENKSSECQFCVPSEVKTEERERGAAISVTIRQPPYIVDYGPDSDVDKEGGGCDDSSRTLINYSTLTPVVMSSSVGEFAVSANRQAGDLCAHSIRMVGVGWLPPSTDEDVFIDSAVDRRKNFSDYDNSYVSSTSSSQNNNGNIENLESNQDGFLASNNARFMGLRGPMMLHSWGYDLDGYPVPNASGDPLIGNDGEQVTDGNGNAVFATQKQLSDGSFSEPFPTQEFAKNWASAPNTWPVGPIDLRWNSAAKIWTVGVEYDDVYVTLENDLNGNIPVRAILKDAQDHSDPLPDGLRKLVFVQDPNSTFAAPRGTTLYAKYNVDTGYYNPIYNTTTFTSGTIIGNGAASVSVGEEVYDVGYANPLNLTINVGGTAIFMFINGEWIINSTSC